MSTSAVDHGAGKPARWLRERRLRIALWIAVVEGLLVWLARGFHLGTIFGLVVVAALAVGGYVWATGRSRAALLNEALWVVAASQVFAALIVFGAWLVFWVFVLLVIAFAVVALFVLFADRK